MDLTKSFEFFDPTNVTEPCHIIGCGSVGSHLAENLVRLGLTKFVLYDFDKIEAHNLANQAFRNADVGRNKAEALFDLMAEINPEIKAHTTVYTEGYSDQQLRGYVFLCVDNIDLRRKICEDNRMNRQIKAVFDFRTGLTEAQCYAAEWGDLRAVNNLIKTMNFSHEEAHEATPKTACGRELGVAATVVLCVINGVVNFVNYIKGEGLKSVIYVDAFKFGCEAF